jgi:Fe-S cluster assembly protein SufD
VASHSNSVGTIPSEILFYLKSRGLHEKQIKELMILGYTKPVITKIDDLDLQKQILGKLGAEL